MRRIKEEHLAITHVVVEDALHDGERTVDDALDLLGQLALDIFLETTEKERTDDLVETVDDEQRLFLVDVDVLDGVGKRRIEPLLKVLDRVEDARQQKVEQRPQLWKRVLLCFVLLFYQYQR